MAHWARGPTNRLLISTSADRGERSSGHFRDYMWSACWVTQPLLIYFTRITDMQRERGGGKRENENEWYRGRQQWFIRICWIRIKCLSFEQKVNLKVIIASPKLNITQEDAKYVPAPVVTLFKLYFFEEPVATKIAALRWFPVEEEFSASIWDHCQTSIARNLGNYCFIAVIPI